MIEREPFAADDDLDDEDEPDMVTCWACGLTYRDAWWRDACPGCDEDRWPGREGG